MWATQAALNTGEKCELKETFMSPLHSKSSFLLFCLSCRGFVQIDWHAHAYRIRGRKKKIVIRQEELEKRKRMKFLSRFQAQWHSTGSRQWEISFDSMCLAMASTTEELDEQVRHLTNYNRVSYRWHRENRFPYPRRHSLFHGEELRKYIFELDHRYSFVSRADVRQLNEDRGRWSYQFESLTQRIEGTQFR